MQIDADKLRYVIASTAEKPYDDFKDYKADLSDVYKIKLKKTKDPVKATQRVTKRVKAKFELELNRMTRPSKMVRDAQKILINE